MPLIQPKSLLDKSFVIGIIIKGIDGVLELIGGILVLTLSPGAITGITSFLTENELQEDPHNFIANHIVNLGEHLSKGHNLFAAAFLVTHGIVKIVLVVCLLLGKRWVYPWAIGVLGLFLVYQFYQLATKPTFGMAFLTALDIAIIYLIYREWRKIETAQPIPHATA